MPAPKKKGKATKPAAKAPSKAKAALGRAWSYSRLLDYERCPQLYKFKAIDRLPEPPNQYMARGQEIHTLAETWLQAKKAPKVPQPLARVKDTLAKLRKLGAIPEAQWTFTRDFVGTTDWFGKDAWCRVKLDAVSPIVYKDAKEVPQAGLWTSQMDAYEGTWVVDWKTGQFRPEGSADQLELYALASFLQRDDIKFVLATLVYVDVGREVHAFYPHTDGYVQLLKKKWLKRVEPLQTDTKFKPTPGPACKWCFFSNAKGGPCLAG